ncbi:MAG: hypothetical protein HKM88_08090, partial [Halobacteria archaeon]|nr:hypothetical protein [Halobacteria archaeon]
MGQPGVRRRRLLLTAALLVFVLLWAYETDSLFGPEAPGTLSCSAYKANINSLYKLIPSDTTPEARCLLTPHRCGPTGLLFNPPGMQTYYYRSQCYHDLAIASLNEAHCAAVIERKSLLFDGSHYSQHACLARVRQIRADQAAPRVDPNRIARIETLAASLEQDRELAITITLAPEKPVYGAYALTTTAQLDGGSTGTAQVPQVTLALNASHPAITRDRRYARLLPVGDEVLQLTPEHGKPASLTYRA